MRPKHLLIILFLCLCPCPSHAQSNELLLGIRTGHYAPFGCFGAFSLQTSHLLPSNFSVLAGLQYNTIGKTSIEARPSYGFGFSWGKLSVQALLSCSHFSSAGNFAFGAAACLHSKWVSTKIGYYYRLYGSGISYISEPFNICYELRAHLLHKSPKWKLELVDTNCEIFEIERHYQPSFHAQCLYSPLHALGINFGVGCKPAGMFNSSANYYQTYIKTGVCYRW